MAENWNIKYETEKENREKFANQLLESNKLTNQKSEEIENAIAEMERYRHLYNEISEKYNNERIVFENTEVGALFLLVYRVCPIRAKQITGSSVPL